MTRRSRAAKFKEDGRDSIGHTHVEHAIRTINRLCRIAVATMTSYERTREETLPMLFDDGDLEKLRQVRGLVTPWTTTQGYDVAGVMLFIDYNGALLPTVAPGCLRLDKERIAPLEHFISQVREVHEKYEELKAVLRWLNRNATPSAIRYYWPTALQLCPNSPAFAKLKDLPTRYDTPPYVGAWIPAMRSAATTWASAKLLPSTAEPRERGTMWLNFAAQIVHLSVNDNAWYQTDAMGYNI